MCPVDGFELRPQTVGVTPPPVLEPTGPMEAFAPRPPSAGGSDAPRLPTASITPAPRLPTAAVAPAPHLPTASVSPAPRLPTAAVAPAPRTATAAAAPAPRSATSAVESAPPAPRPVHAETGGTRATGPGSARRVGSAGHGPDAPPSNSRPSFLRDGPEEDEQMLGRVLGSYRLKQVIGRGGMGRVFLAEHVLLGRRVALKLLRAEYAARRDAVARFFQEAKAVNRIRHRNIVDVTDFVELDDGTTFIIMELLEGVSLGRLVRAGGPLAHDRLLAILGQVCEALEAAHAVGVVHRDLKPDNIFIVADDRDGSDVAKLLDFGVAKLLTDDEETDSFAWKTAAGAVVGTPAFMSPEQAAGRPVDGRSDVYSLGAIMYELFSGRLPFIAKSFGEYVIKHMSEAPEPPRKTPGGAGIPVELEEIILRCLAKAPDDRFQTVVELRQALIALPARSLSEAAPGAPEEDLAGGPTPPTVDPPSMAAGSGLVDAPADASWAPAGRAVHAAGSGGGPAEPVNRAAVEPTVAARFVGAHGAHLQPRSGDLGRADTYALGSDAPLGPSPSMTLEPLAPETLPPERLDDELPFARTEAPDSDEDPADLAPTEWDRPFRLPDEPIGLPPQPPSPMPPMLSGSYDAAPGPWGGRALVITTGVVLAAAVSFAVFRVAVGGDARRESARTTASRGAPTAGDAATPAERPVVQPIVVPIAPGALEGPPPAPSAIRISFRSEPIGAGIFVPGATAPTCETPCTIDVDPVLGDSPTRRRFLLRRAGYEEREVTVRLDEGPRQEVAVTLEETSRRPVRPRDRTPPGGGGTPTARPPGGGTDHIDRTHTMDPFKEAPR